LIAWLQSLDPNQRNFWIGLVMLFIGLTGLISVFMAFTVAGAVMVVESMITSYLAGLINSRSD
jgi:hypothetical protein